MNGGSKAKPPFGINPQRSQQQQPAAKRAISNNYSHTTGNLMVGYRKTSAEIVSEAKNLLAGGGGGVRLVSTRRPITPREPRRQLYGKLAPPGRPPSAFSLRYLQFESRALPSLQPIQQQAQSSFEDIPIVPRSGSIGTLLDYVGTESSNSGNVGSQNNNGNSSSSHGGHQGKLPALLSPPKITASLDNLSDSIPPPRGSLAGTSSERDSNNNKGANEEDIRLKPEPKLSKTRQTRSLDTSVPDAEHTHAKPATEEDEGDEQDGIFGNENTFMPKKRLFRSNDLLAQSTTETLLDMLKAHAGIKECSEETVQHINAILVELYTRVKGAKGNWRSAVLGALYGLVECASPKILLAVARVVLALCVTGSNLTGACKLTFKIARNETNDQLFADSDVPELLIDGLGRASPVEDPEACIYGYGAVRFLASAVQTQTNANGVNGSALNNNTGANGAKQTTGQVSSKQKSIAQRLARHGAVQLMVLHLQIINEYGAVQKLAGPPLHALYQLAAALRALAGIPQSLLKSHSAKKFVSKSSESSDEFPIIQETKEAQEIHLELACPHLIKAAEVSIGEAEVQSNIVRTLSVLSEHNACCEALAEFSARLGILLGPCSELTNGVPEKPLALLSRLGYILGNIMAKFDSARIQFYNNDVAMEYLIDVLKLYSNQKLTIHNQTGDTVVDVIIKLVRVIANMSVNHDVGTGLGFRQSLGDILLRLLVTANNMKQSKLKPEMEEMLLATLGALHNLCFYQDNISEHTAKENNTGSLCERMSELSTALCTTLSNGPEAARAEAARVLGNVTTNQIARDAFCAAGGLKVILNSFNTDDYELVTTSSGVLVNLLGDSERRKPFFDLNGPRTMQEVLHKAADQEDWLQAGIVCQALWNYVIDNGNVIKALGENESDRIGADLIECLDEAKIFNGEPPDPIWEQFATVATDLLERIQSSMSFGDSPCGSSDDDERERNAAEL